MKFNNYIKEEILNSIEEDYFILSEYHIKLFKLDEKGVTIPNIHRKIVEKAIDYLTKKFNLGKNDLEYIGFTDLDFIKKGSKLFQFNILKKGHEKYGSTVAYRY